MAKKKNSGANKSQAKPSKSVKKSVVNGDGEFGGFLGQCCRVLVVLVLVVAAYALFLVNLAGEFRTLQRNIPDGCVRVSANWPDRSGKALGFEDLDTWGAGAGLGSGLAVASAEDRHASMDILKVGVVKSRQTRLLEAPNGAMYVMRNGSALEHVPILGDWVAKNPGFHPHGVSAVATADQRPLVAVVNHAPAGEQIELFELVSHGGGQQLALKHLETVRAPADLFRGLNDVVMISEKELYTSNWHYFPMGTLLNTAETLLRLPLNYVIRCVKGANDWKCESVAAGLIQANGLAAFGDYVYVVDPLGPSIHVYKRQQNGNLNQLAVVPTVSGCDNIWTDGRRILTACHPRLFGFVAHSQNPTKTPAPSNVLELVARTANNGATEYHLKDVFMDEIGDTLSASSAAILHAGRMLIGGVFDEGVLSCPAP